MAEQRICLETAAIAAADTAYALTEFCGTAVTMTTPNKTRLKKVKSTLASDGAATGAGVFFIELGGPGFPGGPHRLAVGGVGGTLATSGIQTVLPHVQEVDITCAPASTFTCDAICNVDTGTASLGVELVFE